jgi:hypothetical protein
LTLRRGPRFPGDPPSCVLPERWSRELPPGKRSAVSVGPYDHPRYDLPS